MLRCSVYNAPNAKISFPKQQCILFLWRNNLEMNEIPMAKERICGDQFNSKDIIQHKRGVTIKDGALPFPGTREPSASLILNSLMIINPIVYK